MRSQILVRLMLKTYLANRNKISIIKGNEYTESFWKQAAFLSRFKAGGSEKRTLGLIITAQLGFGKATEKLTLSMHTLGDSEGMNRGSLVPCQS